MPKKSPRPLQEPLTAEIRSAIRDDGRTLYAIAREAGIEESALRRFVSRERSLSLRSADALAAALGLKLVRKPRRKGHDRSTETDQSDSDSTRQQASEI